jgi:hypothetical protein
MLATATMTLAAGGPLLAAAYLGNAASAIEIGMLGHHPVSATMLGEWLGRRGELEDSPRSGPRTISALPNRC